MATEPDTLTRCPYCQTRFRVTPRQIEAARGRVRCGHCLYVFNALEHAQEEPSAPSSDTDPRPDTRDDELVFDDNPEEDAEEGRYAGPEESEEDEFSEDFLSLDAGDRSGFRSELDDFGSRDKLADDESWAESLLEELESEPETPPADSPAHQPQPAPDPVQPSSQPTSTEAAPPEELDDLDFDAASEPPPTADSYQTPDWSSLRVEPIVAAKPDRWRWLRRLTWLAGTAGMVALLVYQLGWYRFEQLALYEPTRPWYEQACEWFGCELPPLTAPDQLEPQQLVVRSHPDMANALLLELTIVNEAEFEQPWPALALSFSNLNNDVVAQRVFQPSAYLADAEATRGRIPAGQGRRIRLGLQDPGKDAINYRIDFLPPRQ